MKVTGTLVNYYFHCKRQCWLHANKINLEDNSEDVRIGKILHELRAEGNKNSEIAIESIKIDKLTPDYLIEHKKSDANIEAAKWQTLFYLKILKDKGIERKGKIQFDEKNKQEKTIIYVDLTEDIEKRLQELEQEIIDYCSSATPSPAILDKKCKRCAYYDYCYI
ncbi:CRISPR-associated protein Cas4 [Aneurinibacillus uraniidurans]|uniref:CRISPR-associated protein Cas4 n=1 Tax=Aneurinibacillus uraniidurans TaxID=2966586 RepID=UPI00234BD627|nr:CRISPR-associated protein Cas4 [Aneurinibacillus sp. B1]WCN36619.1 CRISPR-associated protein Cas4 [Aneurinibacillus sp. B1]